MTDAQLAAGTYEVLRNRLRESSSDLRRRLSQLNEDRSDVFGNVETRLLATERVTTEHNCVPRDLVSLGDRFLFGYNVQFGLKTDIQLSDVFSVYRFTDHQFHAESLDLIEDKRFENDFHELYRFYKGTTFAQFLRLGPILHMVFHVGKSARDVKTFKWRATSDSLEYLDNRSEHEIRDPAQHEFRWRKTTRDQHRYGVHPHVSVEDKVFVETVGGDLTVKVENNTESGAGIYSEPVDDPDQTLDDAEVFYSVVGNLVLLKVRPYQEEKTRYLLFNAKISQAMRLDEIEHTCVMLPGDQGLIFPGGYYLQTGEFKRFDHGLCDMRYQRTVAAPNGEDFLYLFYEPHSGTYVQLRYNLIRQQVDTPLICHGQTLFEGGEMVCFKAQEQPQKHHAIQIWQTPFAGPDFVPEDRPDSLLFKIGNKELVRGMAECSELLQLIDKDDNYDGLYVDLSKKAGDILDSYFWIDNAETHRLSEPLQQIREAAGAAVEEFEKVLRIRQATESRTQEVEQSIQELLKRIERARFESIDDYVKYLAQLREHRGHALGLRELRYVDLEVVDELHQATTQQGDRLSRRCVDFLLSPGALDPYRDRVRETEEQIQEAETVAEAEQLEEAVDEAAKQLELLTETVSNLRIDDATQRTEIIDAIGDVFASLNRVRSTLKGRLHELVSVEGRAEFASQLKLLEQTTAGYLDVCDSPEKCDEYLTKVMVQLEELEGRFAEFDEFVVKLTNRREEVYAAFESRKVQLVEKRSRRAESLAAAAERILKGIDTRARAMESSDSIAAYFAGDLMVEKVRDIIRQLRELDDTVRVEDLQSRLKTIREDASRQLNDRQDLYEDGGDIIRFGKQRFAVNTQTLDLTTVLRGGELCLHLTGTQFFEPLHDPALVQAKDLWNQELVSENREVYRGEYLAVDLFDSLGQGASRGAADDINTTWIRQQASDRFDEGYSKGVHDHDAAVILQTVLKIDASLGLLRHEPSLRVAAQLWFTRLVTGNERQAMVQWITGFAKLAETYPDAEPAVEFRDRLKQMAEADRDTWAPLFPVSIDAAAIAGYLFDQLTSQSPKPVASERAAKLWDDFVGAFPTSDHERLVSRALEATESDPVRSFVLARNWADAFLHSRSARTSLDPADGYRDELAWMILSGGRNSFQVAPATVATTLESLVGNHPRISSGSMPVHYHECKRPAGPYWARREPRRGTVQLAGWLPQEAADRSLLAFPVQLRFLLARPVLAPVLRMRLAPDVRTQRLVIFAAR